MPEKFFDIIPPEKRVVEPLKEEVKIKKKRPFLKTSLILLLLLIFLASVGSLSFSNVKVEVWPKTELLSFQETITLDLSVNQREGSFIPSKVITHNKSGSQEFFSSGIATTEQKARGVITVYNAYSTSPRTLIPSRFVSADGKLFWSIEKVTIPGARYEKGKLVPGEIDIEVEAAEAGEEYNIEATTFALPALAGTALYTTIYARSFSPMSGGFIGETAQITEQDLESAENTLFEELKKQSKEFLQAGTPQGYVFLDQTILYNIEEKSSSQEPGTITGSFFLDMKVKSEALIFKESDMQNFVRESVESKIEQGQKLEQESLSIDYSLTEISLESGKIILTLDIKARTYQDIDLNEIKKAIAGKSMKEADLFLNNLTGIEKVELKTWSFLRRNVPENLERIETLLKLD